jgi:uncharacterized protein (DUF1684 family)
MKTHASPHPVSDVSRAASADGDRAAGWEAWRAQRLARVNADDGPPTLTRTIWLDETDAVPGAPGRWAAFDDAVSIALPDGERRTLPIGERMRFDEVTTQAIVRDGRIGVRVFEHALAGSVAELEAFPFSAEWIAKGWFEPLPPGTAVAYGYALEAAPRKTEVAGALTFELGGRRYEMQPFDEDGGLFLVFADATTGTQSKPPGRFLRIARPAGGGAGEVEIDFNRGYLPPCAFSDEFNCPLPPPAHRLAVAVTAGETWPRKR